METLVFSLPKKIETIFDFSLLKTKYLIYFSNKNVIKIHFETRTYKDYKKQVAVRATAHPYSVMIAGVIVELATVVVDLWWRWAVHTDLWLNQLRKYRSFNWCKGVVLLCPFRCVQGRLHGRASHVTHRIHDPVSLLVFDLEDHPSLVPQHHTLDHRMLSRGHLRCLFLKRLWVLVGLLIKVVITLYTLLLWW